MQQGLSSESQDALLESILIKCENKENLLLE